MRAICVCLRAGMLSWALTTTACGSSSDGGFGGTTNSDSPGPQSAEDAGGTGTSSGGGDGDSSRGSGGRVVDGSVGFVGIEAGGDDGSGAADAEARADASGDGSGGGTVADLCGEGTNLEASDAGSKTPVSGYGTVEFSASTKTEIVALKTTLTVPAMPPASGTLFLWPGLQPLPGGKSYDPIGNGVLQSVLTWGGTCAPTAPNGYSSWWISAQYVNTYGNDTGHTGCLGGDGIDVAVGDALDIGMALNGTVWNQTVVDRRSGHMATFDLDMLGQAQDWAIFTIEQPTQTKPVSDVVFTSTMLTFADSAPTACQPSARGTNDYFAAPRSSTDGTRCCVSRIILRAQGVAATTPDQP